MTDEATVADNIIRQWKDADGNVIDCDVWDTAGQEQFASLRTMVYPESHVIMISFDMTSKTSLNNLLGPEGWRSEIEDMVPNFDHYILVGTKHDLWEEWSKDPEKSKNCVTDDDWHSVSLPVCSLRVSADTSFVLDGHRAGRTRGVHDLGPHQDWC